MFGSTHSKVENLSHPIRQVGDPVAVPFLLELRAVADQDGEWGTVGQTRTISLADGGSMRADRTNSATLAQHALANMRE